MTRQQQNWWGIASVLFFIPVVLLGKAPRGREVALVEWTAVASISLALVATVRHRRGWLYLLPWATIGVLLVVAALVNQYA